MKDTILVYGVVEVKELCTNRENERIYVYKKKLLAKKSIARKSRRVTTSV